jgi:hypothetical protein
VSSPCSEGFTDERTVHAFNDEGEPLVLEDGRLWIAADLPGFISTVERGTPVGVIGGDGWTARYRYRDVEHDTPVIGFVVDHDGYGGALLTIDWDDGPTVVRDDYPGLELLELLVPSSSKMMAGPLVVRDWADAVPGNGGH